MAYGVTLEAEYQDGYIHSEAELGDKSTFDPVRNTFYDIINNLPAKEHGRLVRFTLFSSGRRYDINWRSFPETAKPIYYRHMERQFKVDGTPTGDAYATAHFFGFEYHDQEGEKQKEIIKIE